MIGRGSQKLIAFAFVMMLSSCGGDDLPDYFQLGKLRVLAIKASLPEVSPGQSLVITPLVTDVDGGSRTLEYTVEACTDPGISEGRDPGCGHDPVKQIQTGTFTLASDRFTGTAPVFNLTVPVTLLNGRTALEQANGIPYLVTYRVKGGGESVTSFRRVLVSIKPVKNKNPILSRVIAGESGITVLPNEEKNLTPVLSFGAESYSFVGSDGAIKDLSEKITISWFITQGRVESSRTDSISANLFSPPNPVKSGPLSMIIVVRDDRGGVDFMGVPAL